MEIRPPITQTILMCGVGAKGRDNLCGDVDAASNRVWRLIIYSNLMLRLFLFCSFFPSYSHSNDAAHYPNSPTMANLLVRTIHFSWLPPGTS